MRDLIALMGTAATAAAVLVALFQEPIKRWWGRPKLEIRASIARFMVFTKPNSPYMAHAYLRLRIRVKSRGGGAKQLQAQVLTCAPSPYVGGIDPLENRDILIPIPWSFTPDETLVDIPAGAARYVDVVEARADEDTITRLSTIRTPPEAQHLLPPSRVPYRIEVLVSGDNVLPVRYFVLFRVQGGWNGSLMSLGQTFYLTDMGVLADHKPPSH